MDDTTSFDARLAWTREHMVVTAKTIELLPDMRSVRLACSMHLEIKMVPAVLGFLARGAEVLLTTCNPSTVNDETVGYCKTHGAKAHAFAGMTAADVVEGFRVARDFRPTHLCEMGADLTTYFVGPEGGDARLSVKAALEATGSGTNRLAGLDVPYPIFNWDDLPIKEGLHNRHMVGLVACHAFFERTRLTFHNKRVLVVGYGLVGRSACDAARAYGGRVLVSERNPARALEARFAGEEVVSLERGLPEADVVITATGARHVVSAEMLSFVRDGAFLLNVGHVDEEIDVPTLLAHPHEEVMPFLTRVHLSSGRKVYLFARGSIANLVAGHGDSLNAFDITLAAMVAGVGFIVGPGASHEPGMHMLPDHAWADVARLGVE